MNYLPPFLIPSEPQVIRQGMMIGNYYGQASPDDPLPQDFDLSAIEEYAPTVATLIQGLSPDESIAVLEARIENLTPYKDVPGVGIFVTAQLNKYEHRLVALKREAQYDRFRKYLLLAGVAFGVIALAGLARKQWQ